jgi:hypothetical protein
LQEIHPVENTESRGANKGERHKPPMKSFEEAIPRCNIYRAGRAAAAAAAAPLFYNMDVATI